MHEVRFSRALLLLLLTVIVLAGGMSQIEELYNGVTGRWDRYVFSDRVDTPLVPAVHGDSSGVRGAAWLWG